MKANKHGLEINPVWNKSNREHTYVHSHPADTRKEADAAVAALGYKGQYFVDADHINFSNVAPFVAHSDFFTLDVASFIGKESSQEDIQAFISSCSKYVGKLQIPGFDHALDVTPEMLEKIAQKFLAATQQAADIYNFLKTEKGVGNFITEVSMDEVESPQTPLEMLFILKMLLIKVPAQTFAPKLSRRSIKVLIIKVTYSNLPKNLKKMYCN
jgi:hypothetical protein